MSDDCYFMCHSISLFQWQGTPITYYSILDGIGRVGEEEKKNYNYTGENDLIIKGKISQRKY